MFGTHDITEDTPPEFYNLGTDTVDFSYGGQWYNVSSHPLTFVPIIKVAAKAPSESYYVVQTNFSCCSPKMIIHKNRIICMGLRFGIDCLEIQVQLHEIILDGENEPKITTPTYCIGNLSGSVDLVKTSEMVFEFSIGASKPMVLDFNDEFVLKGDVGEHSI